MHPDQAALFGVLERIDALGLGAGGALPAPAAA